MTLRTRNVLLMLLALPLLGMGALGGQSAAPERNFQGTFVDRDGIKVEAKWINVGGEVALNGDLGRGSLRVPFDNIKSIQFSGGEGRGDGLVAKVALRQGEQMDLKVRNSLVFSGQTPVGTYRIRARDLRALDLQSQ